jgi:hypothetical protein
MQLHRIKVVHVISPEFSATVVTIVILSRSAEAARSAVARQIKSILGHNPDPEGVYLVDDGVVDPDVVVEVSRKGDPDLAFAPPEGSTSWSLARVLADAADVTPAPFNPAQVLADGAAAFKSRVERAKKQLADVAAGRVRTLLQPHESTPANNPNHPAIRCVDGTGPYGEWTSAYDKTQEVTAPYRVFDILNQEHVDPEFDNLPDAEAYLAKLGGQYTPPTLNLLEEARKLVAKLERWPGVHPAHYADLKAAIEAQVAKS